MVRVKERLLQILSWLIGRRASFLTFQGPTLSHAHTDTDTPLMAQSTVSSYRSFEKRDGLSSMARRVLDGIRPFPFCNSVRLIALIRS